MRDSRVYTFGPILLIIGIFLIAAVNQTTVTHSFSVNMGADTTITEPNRGEFLYRKACSACHGIRGRGVSQSQLGFATPLPDLSDCNFATREPDADWIAIAHQGGPVRGFAKDMPAFGETLSEEELEAVIEHIRTFCTDDDWPRGDLNLPRALVTEKAYPEDEAVVSSSIDVEGEGSVMNKIVYEKRIGARNQFELVVPFGFRQDPGGNWNGGQLGDLALGFKRALYHNFSSGTIFSVTGEVILPTGDRLTGFGKGTTIIEPFLSFGQILPANSFVQFQGGMELPLLRDKATEEAFWRGLIGSSISQGAWGRTWSPMVEFLGARELESGAQTQWDIVPQMQVTLNKRQNIMLNVGVRMPLDDPSRDTQLMVYFLWDWFDGGLFEGW
ncbi:MAG: cytochrome c [Balneolaceae bacterium]|jgi:mono/diheme cytochrome c family protein